MYIKNIFVVIINVFEDKSYNMKLINNERMSQ